MQAPAVGGCRSRPVLLRPLALSLTPMHHITYCPQVLAVAGDRSQITMVGGGKVIGYVPEAPEAGLGGITAMKFSGDSKKLAIGCSNRSLHVRDLRSQVRAREAGFWPLC